MVEHYHRYRDDAEFLGGRQSAMPGDKDAIAPGQDWIGETEFAIKAALCAT